jgi:hypothetical protein
MPIELTWYNPERTIIFQKNSGTYTLEDLHTSISGIYKMLETVDHPVDLIVDFTNVKMDLRNPLSARSHWEKASHPNGRSMIIINPPMFAKAILQIGQQIAPHAVSNFHYVTTVEEAMTIVGQQNMRVPA